MATISANCNYFKNNAHGLIQFNGNYSNSNSGHPNGFPQDSTLQFGNFWRWKSESSVEGTLSGDSGFSSTFAVKIMNFWVRNADPKGILGKPFATLSASLRQLQLLKVKYAKYEPTAMSSSEMCTV